MASTALWLQLNWVGVSVLATVCGCYIVGVCSDVCCTCCASSLWVGCEWKPSSSPLFIAASSVCSCVFTVWGECVFRSIYVCSSCSGVRWLKGVRVKLQWECKLLFDASWVLLLQSCLDSQMMWVSVLCVFLDVQMVVFDLELIGLWKIYLCLVKLLKVEYNTYFSVECSGRFWL